VSSLHIIYASGSGHTEYVVDLLSDALKGKGIEVEKQRAELTKIDDFDRGDVLLLACGSWNTGGPEGQLQPFMYDLLLGRAQNVNLNGRKCVVIGLGDERYFYTARAGDHLEEFVQERGGELILETLLIINEPYGQEEKIKKWGDTLLKILS